MLVTDFTRTALENRRTRKKWREEGFIRVDESGGALRRLRRGDLYHKKITEVRIDPNGKELWVMVK